MSSGDHSTTDSHLEEWAALLGTDLDRPDPSEEADWPDEQRIDDQRT
jgi:hypothetical protein